LAIYYALEYNVKSIIILDCVFKTAVRGSLLADETDSGTSQRGQEGNKLKSLERPGGSFPGFVV